MYQQDPSSELASFEPSGLPEAKSEVSYHRAAMVGTARVIAAGDGAVLFSSPAAASILRQHCEPPACTLPKPMVAWLQNQATQGERFSISLPACELIACCISWLNPRTLEPRETISSRQDDGSVALLGLAEQSVLAMQERLTRHENLTSREAEILAWMAFGKTGGEIAAICGARPRTIDKHVEHVFQKLGVSSRTAATAVAWSHLSAI